MSADERFKERQRIVKPMVDAFDIISSLSSIFLLSAIIVPPFFESVFIGFLIAFVRLYVRKIYSNSDFAHSVGFHAHLG